MGARCQADCVTRSVLVTPGYAEVSGKREIVKQGREMQGGLRNSIGLGKVRRSETQIDVYKRQDQNRIDELMERFGLNPQGKIKKMSKGMKQKIGIVCAFMNDPDVIILDEPTSGLDPLMQNEFVELLLEEKQKGKTIFMSSHIFEEVERTCDRTAIIKDGKIVTIEDMASLKAKKQKSFVITFDSEKERQRFSSEPFEIARAEGNTAIVVLSGDVDGFLKAIAGYQVRDLDIKASSLEEIFLHYYGEEAAK